VLKLRQVNVLSSVTGALKDHSSGVIYQNNIFLPNFEYSINWTKFSSHIYGIPIFYYTDLKLFSTFVF
jgi:hypothetical protein